MVVHSPENNAGARADDGGQEARAGDHTECLLPWKYLLHPSTSYGTYEECF
jgi:hypothetical protein